MTESIPLPPWRSPRKGPARMPLSQDQIVRAALEILDAEGLDALSMRRLAQELGTGPASLYVHVANKDELLDLLYDLVLSEVVIPEPEPGRWAEQVREMLRSLRSVFRAHRDLARVSLTRIPLGPNGIVGMERTMRLLRAGGLPDEIAAYAGDLLTSFVTVETLDDAFPGDDERPAAGAGGPRTDFVVQIRRYLESLPVEQFPTVTTMAGAITSLDSERRFELGLDIIIRGLATYADHPDPLTPGR